MLEGAYNSKKQFVRDFLKKCRELQKEGTAHYLIPEVRIQEELWEFLIEVENKKVATTSIFKGKRFETDRPYTDYDKTVWGQEKPYVRWDSELKKFLEREVCKVCEEDHSEDWPKRYK